MRVRESKTPTTDYDRPAQLKKSL